MRIIFVIGFLCVNLVVCENVYRAAIVDSQDNIESYSTMIKQAAKMKADILLLPSDENPLDSGKYDKVTKSLSKAAKQSGIYVVTHLHEKIYCQNRDEIIRSSLVFDRQGSIIAAYRKPLNNAANCSTTSEIPTFTTEFGVRFSLLMEEDLVLTRPEQLNVKNFVVHAALTADVPFLSGSQFSSSWAYVTNANLVTSSGIFAGKAGIKTGAGKIFVAELNKDGGMDGSQLTINPTKLTTFPGEDLSKYIIRPLDLETTIKGYKESVCSGKFCCEFYVKGTHNGSANKAVSYGLAVFVGSRHYYKGRHIGTQSCSIVACAGLYKRTCNLGINNSTNTHFEKVTISGNFSASKSSQFPIILSTSETHNLNFRVKTIKNSNQVTIDIQNGKNLMHFGIFSRDYTKDFDNVEKSITADYSENFYDYFFNENFNEFFDYLWIRLRVLIVIVSVYVLEMM